LAKDKRRLSLTEELIDYSLAGIFCYRIGERYKIKKKVIPLD